jgi:predicted nucleic acid-binding protein
VTSLLADTSVLVKWFHAENESEVAQARELRRAHLGGIIAVRHLDLARYELGNVLLRSLNWPADRVADQLDDLTAICGPPIVPPDDWLREAARLGARHGLTFYDAAWAASAQALGIPLISADQKLLAAGLAESATFAARRLLG